ncbi:hypothetical protein VPH35_134505 [Triticum aestivum]
MLGLSFCWTLWTGSRSGRCSPTAGSTQIRFLWCCCRQAKPIMLTRQTQMPRLVAGNRWAVDGAERAQRLGAVRQRPARRSQLTESTPRPLLEKED